MSNRTSLVTAGTILVLFVLLTLQAAAQVSRDIINYQGKLTDATGPMDGPVTMAFAIYDTETPGMDLPLWLEGGVAVEVENGIFSVSLGAQTAFPADLFDTNDDLYLSITVEGEEMDSLQHLTATPYAMKAGTADHAHTATAANSVLTGTVTGNLLVDGSVGIGTDIPESLMHLKSMGGIDLIIEADTNNSGGEDQNARVVLRQDGGEVTGRMGYRHEENDLELMQAFNDDLIFGTNNNDRMTIKNDGKIGIGTSIPDAELHVAMTPGSTLPNMTRGLLIEDATSNFGSRIEIRDENGVAEFRIDAGGDVDIGGGARLGIGIANPEARLHVVMPDGNPGIPPTPSTVGGLIIDDGTWNSGNQLEIRDDQGNSRVVVDSAGQVGIGTAVPETALAVRGNVTVLSAASGDLILELGEGLDYAEGFDVTDERLEPGTVLAIDAENPGHLTMCRTAYDRKVAGIVAGARGLGSGVRLGGQRFDQDVALAGRVYCKVDATNESILSGDLLTTSGVTGHAMKVVDYSRAQGAVLGKAMEPLERGKKGMILVLVTLQ